MPKPGPFHSEPHGAPVAVVTGASSGIGRATAVRLAERGYRVGLLARRRAELDSAAEDIRGAGGRAFVAAADVTDLEALKGAVDAIERDLGPVDLLVANAGFAAPTRLDPLNVAEVETTIRVNLLGVIYSVGAVLPGMLARGRGHLLAVSSLAAFKGLPGESAYCASKAGVNAYMEGLRIALRRRGVVVTTVCPGFVRTAMTESAPMDTSATPFEMSADAAARRIVRAATRGRGGLVRFPAAMAWVTDVVARLPDAVVARLVRVSDAGAEVAPAGGRPR